MIPASNKPVEISHAINRTTAAAHMAGEYWKPAGSSIGHAVDACATYLVLLEVCQVGQRVCPCKRGLGCALHT